MNTQLSILIVDDVSTVRSFLSQTLMHLGIENVKEASTAAQCISECRAANFNIIFLDIDGVLNCTSWYEKIKEIPMEYHHRHFWRSA